jgi:hypothetical protein
VNTGGGRRPSAKAVLAVNHAGEIFFPDSPDVRVFSNSAAEGAERRCWHIPERIAPENDFPLRMVKE